MHFTSVDFPAPLSPTSATTSPGETVISTSRRTCTGPKLLFSSRISRMGSGTGPPSCWWPDTASCPATVSSGGAIGLLDARSAAGCLDTLADLGCCQSPGVDHVHHVGLRDDLSREQQRLQVVAGRLRVVELA